MLVSETIAKKTTLLTIANEDAVQVSLITLLFAVSSMSLPTSSNQADVHSHGSLMSMRTQAVMTSFTRAFTVQVPIVSSIQQAQS